MSDATLPSGIRAIVTARHAELVYWLPEQHAVVVGDGTPVLRSGGRALEAVLT
jgi:hypothetical protein